MKSSKNAKNYVVGIAAGAAIAASALLTAGQASAAPAPGDQHESHARVTTPYTAGPGEQRTGMDRNEAAAIYHHHVSRHHRHR